MGEKKHLLIRYVFRDSLHELIVDDVGAVAAPLRGESSDWFSRSYYRSEIWNASISVLFHFADFPLLSLSESFRSSSTMILQPSSPPLSASTCHLSALDLQSLALLHVMVWHNNTPLAHPSFICVLSTTLSNRTSHRLLRMTSPFVSLVYFLMEATGRLFHLCISFERVCSSLGGEHRGRQK